MSKRRDRATCVPRRRGAAVLVTCAILVALSTLALIVVVVPPDVERSSSASDPVSRARRLLEDGKLNEARHIYEKELARDSKCSEAVRGLAMCCREAGDDEHAIPLWERLTMMLPGDAAAFRQLALAYHRVSKDVEALSAAQTAMALSPDGDAAMAELVSKLVTSTAMAERGRPDRHPGSDALPGFGHGRAEGPMNGLPDPFRGVPRPPDPARSLPRGRKN